MNIFTIIRAKSVKGVPDQKTGGFNDTESERACNDPDEASVCFNVLKDRFFAINHWKDFCKNTIADLSLYNKHGHIVEKMAETGDFVKIEILASPDIGTKYYWVEIRDIIHAQDGKTEKYLITFNPSIDPTTSSKHIAHFYNSKSSSTFLISKEFNIIRASVYGRNETPNFNTDLFNCIINISIFNEYKFLQQFHFI